MATRDRPATTFTDPTLSHVGRMLICGCGAGAVIGAVTALLLIVGTDGGLDVTGGAVIGAFVGLPLGTVIALIAAVLMLRLRRRRPDLRGRVQRQVLLAVCAASTLVVTLALSSLVGLSAAGAAVVVLTATALTSAAAVGGAGWCLAPIAPRLRLDDSDRAKRR